MDPPVEQFGALDGFARLSAFESLINHLFGRFVAMGPDDLEPALDSALAEIGTFVGADRCYIVRYDHDDETTWMTHEWCAPGIEPSFDQEQGVGFWDAPRQQERLAALEINEIRDVSALPPDWDADRAYLEAQGITAILEVPFALDGRITGVIGFDSTDGAVPWRPEDVTALRAVASLLEQVLARSIREDDSRAAAEALRLSEQRFQTLVDNLPDAVIRFDRTGKVLFANSTAERLRDRFALPGRTDDDGWPKPDPEVMPLVSGAIAEAFGNGVSRTLEYPVGQAGDRMWNEVTFVPERGEDDRVDSVLLVARDVTDRRRQAEELEHQATHDTLTGLPNRSLLVGLLEQAGETLARRDGSLAVLFFDLDRFKVVNDSLGHVAGDELLRVVADRVSSVLRPGDVLARLGGDEFTVMLTDVEESEAVGVAERLQAALRPPVVLEGKDFSVSASVGIVRTTTPLDPAELLRRADAAMYRSKDLGRNRICTFDESLLAEVSQRLELDQQLRRAFERDELRVHYQPEVDLARGTITGAEALLRWEHPDRGLLTAGEFVPVAEDNGMIVPLGSWVLAEACRTVAAWCDGGIVDHRFVIRVNLSARQLDRPGLAEEVASVLATTGLEPRRLCLEVTETALMNDADLGLAALGELHRVGVRLAIDDFGTGYSSLSFLKRFPLDVLKIDRSFVDGLPDDPEDVAIVTTILGLARSLGLAVTAEGVESEAQRQALVDLGCRTAQGFLFSAAVPPDDLASELASCVRSGAVPAGRPDA